MTGKRCFACATGECPASPPGGDATVYVAALSDAKVKGLRDVIDTLCPRHRHLLERMEEQHLHFLATRAPS